MTTGRSSSDVMAIERRWGNIGWTATKKVIVDDLSFVPVTYEVDADGDFVTDGETDDVVVSVCDPILREAVDG